METDDTRVGGEFFCPKSRKEIALIKRYKKPLDGQIIAYIFTGNTEVLTDCECHHCLKEKDASIENEIRPEVFRYLLHAKIPDKRCCEVQGYFHCFVGSMGFSVLKSNSNDFNERKDSSEDKDSFDIRQLHKDSSKEGPNDKTNTKNRSKEPKVFIAFFSSR